MTATPGDLWQAKARQLVDNAVFNLWTPYGKPIVDFLAGERGLTEATIKKFSLGFLPLDRWEAAPEWGLEEIFKADGRSKKLWIPMGLSIPLCHEDQVLRVRIRRPEPGDGPRFYLLRGSDTRAMVLGQHKEVYVIVESELDAILLAQEAGGLVGVVALGNAQARPDTEAMEGLKQSKLILVALDDDTAGVKESWGWWQSHFCQAHRWPPVAGKDPGDMHLAGVSLRTWIEAGLAEYAGVTIHPEPKPEPGPQPRDIPSGVCLFHHCDLASYRNTALFCGEVEQEVIDLAACPFGLWFKQADGWPVEGSQDPQEQKIITSKEIE